MGFTRDGYSHMHVRTYVGVVKQTNLGIGLISWIQSIVQAGLVGVSQHLLQNEQMNRKVWLCQ